MSTTAMWLLLAVVVIVIVFASVLYKRAEIVVVEFAQHQALGFKNRLNHGKALSFWPQ